MKEKKLIKIDPVKKGDTGKQSTEELTAKKQRNKNGRSTAEEEKNFDKDYSSSHKGLPIAKLENEQQDCLGEPGKNNYYILGRDDYNYVDDDRD